MDYLVIGLNHNTAPVKLREKFALTGEKTPQFLEKLLENEAVSEAMLLSTCNRVEVYTASADLENATMQIESFLAGAGQVAMEALRPHLYRHEKLSAVEHSMRVAASLDSMILGEPQILSQVKNALQMAMENGYSGTFLNRLMNRVLAAAKKIREETKIGSGAVSIGSVSVDLAARIFGDLTEKVVCLIGAGTMGELILTHLKENGVQKVLIVNRTASSALELESKGLGQAMPWDQMKHALLQADVVITSAGGDGPLLTAAESHHLMQERKNQPLFLIDLGVPRNIESQVGTINNIYLYDIDDLKKVSDDNQSTRQEEAKKASELLQKEASKFYESMLNHQPTIAQLNQKFELIRQTELNRTLKGRKMEAAEVAAWEACTKAIVSQILKDPILHLKGLEPHFEKAASHDLLKKLFRLEDD